MPSIGEEKGSTKSIRSSSPSSHSTERPVSVHDHEDQEKVVALGSLPLSPRPSFSNKAASIATNGTNNPDYEVDWDDEIDPKNPRNWYLGWRWTNWIVMIISGVAFIFMCMLKETYAPALLQKKAKLRRKEQDDDRYWSRYDNKIKFWPLLKVNLSRPFIMVFTEPIRSIFWDVYIAIIYGILYLCFVAYPIVFTGVRGWSAGISGLAFTGLAVGCFLVIGTEPLLRRMINSHKKDPETGKVPPEAMVSVVCIAAVLVPVGELWFAWTCVPPVHWIWPILAGIPFGAGNTAVFIYASNYLAHSYGSKLHQSHLNNSTLMGSLQSTPPQRWLGTRSFDLSWVARYRSRDQHVAIIPIPVYFYRYGHKIRMKSALIQSMQQDKEKLESKRRSGVRAAKLEKVEDDIAKVYSKTV
ncbi:hypothetical protein HO133_006022 [Letharia lupina]|uniref:Transmembrane protein n=1 Tax=Letharia lupina TaxID=560253 RepID=A0A8H6C8K3_9LECA|nr:uncharacterized protein HO133_006022 [Letharia lupina]KAF6218671.1 hypothetical protein HO133_006022 [Letharia lupina]